MPTQTIVYSPKGHNNTTTLPFHTSLYDLKQSRLPPRNQIMVRDGLRLFSPDAALVRVPESFFRRNQIEVQVVLSGITDVSNLLRMLLDGGHSAIAGRLAGALRRVNRAEQADEILSTMKAAGYDVRESDPFESEQNIIAIGATEETPIVGRLKLQRTVPTSAAPGFSSSDRPSNSAVRLGRSLEENRCTLNAAGMDRTVSLADFT